MFSDPKACGRKGGAIGGKVRSNAKATAARLNARKRWQRKAVPDAAKPQVCQSDDAKATGTPAPQTAEGLRAEIAEAKATLRTLEIQCADLTKKVREENGVQSAGLEGKSNAQLLRENVQTAGVLRKVIQQAESDLITLEKEREKTSTPMEEVYQRLHGTK